MRPDYAMYFFLFPAFTVGLAVFVQLQRMTAIRMRVSRAADAHKDGGVEHR